MEHAPGRRTIATMGGMKISIEESFDEPLVCIDFNNGSDETHMRLRPEAASRFAEAISEAAHTVLRERCEKHEVWEPYEDIGVLGPDRFKYETSDHGRMRLAGDHSIVRPSGFSSEGVIYDFRGGGYLEMPVKRGCICLATW